METAISVPDEIFQAAERAAESLSVSRSEFYSRALKAFLSRHSACEITQQLNDLYGQEASGVDPILYGAAVDSVGAEQW